MQQRLVRRFSFDAKVGDHETMAAEQRSEILGGLISANTKKLRAWYEIQEQEEVNTGMVVEQESRIYGYAFIGVATNIIFLLAVSVVPLTEWNIVESEGLGAQQQEQRAVPGVDRWAWALGVMGPFILNFSLRCTFAISTGSPRPLPGLEIDCWKCALVCFISMTLSGYGAYGLTYYLPIALGASPEFYHLNLIPMILDFTVCILFTRRVMRAYYNSMQEGQDIHGLGNGQTPATVVPEKKEESSSTTKEDKSDASSPQPRQEKSEEQNETTDIWKELLSIANTVILCTLIIACALCSGSGRGSKRSL